MKRLDLGDWVAALPRGAKASLFVALLTTFNILHFAHLDEARRVLDSKPLVANAEVLYVPDERMSRLTMLGYDQAAADLLWLRTLGYFGQHFTTDRRYEWLEFFIEQIIALDPRFKKVYHWAGANVLYGRRFTNENVMVSNRFYELALARFPEDFEAAYRLGLNHYVELRSSDRDERRRYKQKGLDYLEMAANMPNAPARLRNLVAGISNTLGEPQIAVQYLLDQLVHEQDPERRAALKERVAKLRADMNATDLADSAAAFQADHAATFPYIPHLLFIQLGEPTERRWADVSWRKLLPDIVVEGGLDP